MRRSEASPEAETPSYWPVFISATIEAEVSATLAFTLQPVLRWNGVTQSTVLSVEPFSAYPAQPTRFRLPSEAPTSCCIAIFGASACLPAPESAPHAPSASTSVAAQANLVSFIPASHHRGTVPWPLRSGG